MWIEQNEQVRAQPRLARIGMMLRPKHRFRLVVALRIRQLVEIFEQRPRRCGDHSLIATICDAMNVAPVLARADGVRQLDQRCLSLEPDDAIQFRNQFESLLIAQAGKVPAHREVAIDAVRAQEGTSSP